MKQSKVKARNELVLGVIRQEIERMEGRRGRWEESLCRLEARYESAKALRQELEPLLERDRAFVARLEEAAECLRPLGVQMRALMKEADARGESSLRLVWRGDEGRFVVQGAGAVIDVDAAVEPLFIADAKAQSVGYPIIFTHQTFEDQRAVGYAIGLAVIFEVAQTSLKQGSALKEVCFELLDRAVVLSSSGTLNEEALPSAEDFGFSRHGEVSRRIEEFSTTDPAAHRVKWLQERGAAAHEVWVLRDHLGALLQVEVDRELRRIRLIEQPLSQVIRKRTMVFVDPRPLEVEDGYFAQASEISGALKELLSKRIEQGYRIVYQCLGEGGGAEERGQRPPALLVWPPGAK